MDDNSLTKVSCNCGELLYSAAMKCRKVSGTDVVEHAIIM